MSAAKMVADSTQSDTDSRKKRNRSAGRKGKRSRRDRRRRRHSSSSTDSRHTRSGSDSGTDDYDSDIDLQKELKPLSAYLRSPKELVDQMLHSVRGSSLQRALPDALKDMPMEELRKRCLQHLEVMSRKRMRRILSGDDPTAISSSGTEEDESSDGERAPGDEGDKVDSTAEEGKESKGSAAKGDGGPADSPLSIAANDMDDQVLEEGGGQHVHPAGQEGMEAEDQREEEEEEGEAEEEEEDWDLEGAGDDMADVLFPEVEQDKMELLELEMRARAIKAMLALHEQREKEQKKRVRKR